MICENCGAEIDVHEKACPYCGHINPAGAEEAYMERLEDLQEDLEELKDQGRDSLREEIGKKSRKVIKTGIVLAVLLAGILFVPALMERSWRSDAEDEKKMLAFQKKYFQELDDVYEAGDDDAALDYMIGLMDEEGSEAVFDWDHYPYMQAYWNYRDGVESTAELLTENWDAGLAEEGMLDAFRIIDQAEHPEEAAPGDRARLEELRQKAMDFLTDVIGMTEKEAEELYGRTLDEYRFFDWSECRKLCGEYLEGKK